MTYWRQLLPVFLFFYGQNGIAGVSKNADPDTGLINWTLNQGALEVQFIQRLPDQTRGFFSARGFSSQISNDIAISCVFQIIAKNTQTGDQAKSFTIKLKEWELHYKDKMQQVKLKQQWDAEWSDQQVNQASRIAFRWATFPSEQTFEPIGDNNWGMTSLNLPPESIFDLHIIWHEGNHTQQSWIKNMICPEDR